MVNTLQPTNIQRYSNYHLPTPGRVHLVVDRAHAYLKFRTAKEKEALRQLSGTTLSAHGR